MAGPLSSVGAQPSQIANVSQPNAQNAGNQAIRQREDAAPRENIVQPQGAAAAEAQNTETSNQDILQARISQALESGDSGTAELRRGSIIDIAV